MRIAPVVSFPAAPGRDGDKKIVGGTAPDGHFDGLRRRGKAAGRRSYFFVSLDAISSTLGRRYFGRLATFAGFILLQGA
jgi:hypothetical protein